MKEHRNLLLRPWLPAFLLLAVTSLRGQDELGAHFMAGTWAALQSNPALAVDGDINVMLPQIYGDIYFSSLSYNKIVTRRPDGRSILNVPSALSNLEADNAARENLMLGTLGVSLRSGRWRFHFTHGLRERSFALYPDALPRLIWQGNAGFIGQSVDVSTDVEISQMHEWTVGAAFQLRPSLAVGARLHYLSGMHHFEVAEPRVRVATDEVNYALSLDSDLRVNTSGDFSYEGFDRVSTGWSFLAPDPEFLVGPNHGIMFDLGAHYEEGPWRASLSVLGLGGIRWRAEVKNYAVEGRRSFAGIDVLDSLFQGATTVGPVLDSLERLLGVVESGEHYSTRTPARMYASLGYRLSPRWQLGAVFYQEWYRGDYLPAGGLSAQFMALPWLQLGAVYGYRARTFSNLGLNLQARVGPLRIVAATDSVPALAGWRDASAFNFRLGFSLVFGDPPSAGPVGD